jgi:hypothetical protein
MNKQNHVLHVIFDSASTAVDAQPELQAWEVEYDALMEKLHAQAPELVTAAFDVIVGGMAMRGEAMFLLAWDLRGNPDKLFELPEAN